MSRAKKTDWISYVIVEIPKEQGLGKKTSSGLQVPKQKKRNQRIGASQLYYFVSFVAMKVCCNIISADGRASWSTLNACRRKSCASDVISEGMVGAAEEPILKMACIWESWAHGCSPVSISTTRQPTLQMSALCVWPDCLTTSGAIQKTEPCRDGRFILLPVSRAGQNSKKMYGTECVREKLTIDFL